MVLRYGLICPPTSIPSFLIPTACFNFAVYRICDADPFYARLTTAVDQQISRSPCLRKTSLQASEDPPESLIQRQTPRVPGAELTSSLQNGSKISQIHSSTQPISIPTQHLHQRDVNCVFTPLAGRGDKKDFFLSSENSPTSAEKSCSFSPPTSFAPRSFSGWSRRRRSSSSHSSRGVFEMTMHTDGYSSRYAPTSPLSPRLSTNQRPLSPQPVRARTGHRRQSSRTTPSQLGRYYPGNFLTQDPAQDLLPRSPSPTSTKHRQPPSLEMMRERQRELIDRARMSSKIAASPMGVKPSSPRLDPLGSPKGAVTPLALEDTTDYFSSSGRGTISPARSPGPKPDESNKGIEDLVPEKSKRKLENSD